MLVSLFFAVLLFLTATSSSYNSTQTRTQRVLETYSHTLEDVPIDIKYDSDKYFISGYSYETEVYLTSTNRVKLDSEINKTTRTFKVVADLTRFEEGTSKVPLQIIDLPEEVTATVKPVSMSVTIGRKTTKKFPIEAEFTEDDFAPGYQLASYELDFREVSVMSDESIIDQISHVVAKLPDGEVLSEDYNGEITLQAVNSSGMILPTVIEPAKVKMRVSLEQLNKEVPIRVEYTGTLDVSISDVRYELPQQTVRVYGRPEELDKITEIVAKIDTTGVLTDTTQTVQLSSNLVTIKPEKLDIKLTVTKK